MQAENNNDFKLQLNFGGGAVEIDVITTWINQSKTALYTVLLDEVKLADLYVDLDELKWVSKFGSLDNETIQYIGEKINDYYELNGQ